MTPKILCQPQAFSHSLLDPASRSIGDYPYNPFGFRPKAGNSHIPVSGLRPGRSTLVCLPEYIQIHPHQLDLKKDTNWGERHLETLPVWLWILGAGTALGSVPLRQQTSPT